jgi:hypothetical protein
MIYCCQISCLEQPGICISKAVKSTKGKFSDSPWILSFTAGLNVENNQALFKLVSKNAARNVPFIAELRDVAGSGYSYEAGDPPAPGSVPQAPTPFLGFGLAAIAAKTAIRKRAI